MQVHLHLFSFLTFHFSFLRFFPPHYRSRTAGQPGTPVACSTPRRIASAAACAAVDPIAVSETSRFSRLVERAITWSPSPCVWYGLMARAAPVLIIIASFVRLVLSSATLVATTVSVVARNG